MAYATTISGDTLIFVCIILRANLIPEDHLREVTRVETTFVGPIDTIDPCQDV
jgi:hypothetical protein